MDDYQKEMKGKMNSFLSCIPEMVCLELRVDSDEFILLTTDGIIEAMDIGEVVIVFASLDYLHPIKRGEAGDGGEPRQNTERHSRKLQNEER
jgi:serine/threonine protein phosphatase PrpC